MRQPQSPMASAGRMKLSSAPSPAAKANEENVAADMADE